MEEITASVFMAGVISLCINVIFFFSHPSLLGHLGPQLSFGEQCSGIHSTVQVLWDLLHSPTLGYSALGSTPQPSFGKQCSGILSTAQLLWDRLHSPVLENSVLGSATQLHIVVQFSGSHPTAQLWGRVFLWTLMILVLV